MASKVERMGEDSLGILGAEFLWAKVNLFVWLKQSGKIILEWCPPPSHSTTLLNLSRIKKQFIKLDSVVGYR